MSSRIMKRIGAVALLLGGALALLGGGKAILGQDNREEPRGLVGTWDVTLRFPVCSSQCPCPGGVPNIPIRALHTYGSDGSFLEAGGGSLFRGPGLGLWKHVASDDFMVQFKFFLFKPDGTPRGSEEVTNHVELTGPDMFDANATFDLFDAVGNMTGQGCPITESGTRLE